MQKQHILSVSACFIHWLLLIIVHRLLVLTAPSARSERERDNKSRQVTSLLIVPPPPCLLQAAYKHSDPSSSSLPSNITMAITWSSWEGAQMGDDFFRESGKKQRVKQVKRRFLVQNQNTLRVGFVSCCSRRETVSTPLMQPPSCSSYKSRFCFALFFPQGVFFSLLLIICIFSL